VVFDSCESNVLNKLTKSRQVSENNLVRKVLFIAKFTLNLCSSIMHASLLYCQKRKAYAARLES